MSSTRKTRDPVGGEPRCPPQDQSWKSWLKNADIMKKCLKVSTENLPSTLRKPFETILGVAQTRSMADWSFAPAASADLVCCIPDLLDADTAQARNQIRLWIASQSDAGPHLRDGDVVLAPDNIRLVTLLSALDMAALRLLDSSIYPHLNDSPSQQEQRAERADNRGSDNRRTRYSLSYWPVLSGNFRSRAYQNAAAMLSKRAMTVTELARASGLSEQSASALVDELARVRALKAISRTDARGRKPASRLGSLFAGRSADGSRSGAASAAASGSGFLGRVRAWLSGAHA